MNEIKFQIIRLKILLDIDGSRLYYTNDEEYDEAVSHLMIDNSDRLVIECESNSVIYVNKENILKEIDEGYFSFNGYRISRDNFVNEIFNYLKEKVDIFLRYFMYRGLFADI